MEKGQFTVENGKETSRQLEDKRKTGKKRN